MNVSIGIPFVYDRCSTRQLLFGTASLLFCLISPELSVGETIRDDTLDFTLTLPAGFKRNDELLVFSPTAKHSFVLQLPNEQLSIVLYIEKLGGTIRERIRPEQLPADFTGRRTTANWQGFEIDAFEIAAREDDTDTLTYIARIPLRREAIQIKLFGPANRGTELHQLFREILDGLRGESNWSMSLQAAPRSISPSKQYGTILLIAAGLFALVGLILLWFISRKAPRGTVLAIAVLIYAASFSIDDEQNREVVTVIAAMRLLGFAGGILGLADLFKKRKKPRATPPPIPPST